MFSKIIRFGVAISGAVILSSCGGNSGQTETQQSTPEGLFNGSYYNVTFTNSSGTPPAGCSQNALIFVEYTGAFYSFITSPTTSNPAAVISASSGSLSFSGGNMSSGNVIEVTPPNGINVTSTSPNGTDCGVAITNSAISATNGTTINNEATSPSFTGGYSTGINIAGTFTYPTIIDAAGDYKTSTFNIDYDADYQGVQSLATLAGTYTGTISTSQFSEAGTFTFGPASVAANSGNQFGVGIVSGTGASGCTYTGTVSPLFKGNGYTTLITSGAGPTCLLPDTQFSGLVYLNTTSNLLYSFAPDAARTDGLIFTGTRN